MSDSTSRGFIAAAAFNIVGMGVFSKGLTNTTMFSTDPEMFSRPGCVLVMVWGLAYAAQSQSWRAAPAVSAVFALEKLVYVVWWLAWIAGSGHTLPALFAQDPLTAIFYGAYGLGDAVFMAFFASAAVRARKPV